LSSQHAQFTAEYCLNVMSRPQLLIWYEKAIKRKYNEQISVAQVQWSQTSNLLAASYNTAMGNKKRHKPQDFMPEFEQFDEVHTEKETKIAKAKKLGLKVPEKRQMKAGD